MNKDETVEIMAVLWVAYPNFYKGQKQSDTDAAVKLWEEMFADDDVSIVKAAVKSFIAADNKGFPPVIGNIKNKIAELKNPDRKTEYEAWNEVKKAVSNGIYGAAEEFEKLSPVLQRLVGSPNQLREWAQTNSETLESVIASNFMRSYKARVQNEREYSMLPSDVQKFISEFTKKISLPEVPKQLTEAEVNDRRNDIHRQLREA